MSREILSDDDRRRFALYLEQDAHDNELLAAQLDKIGQLLGAKKYRTEAMAAKIIAKKLRSVETTTLE